MEFREHNGILVPNAEPDPILVFIDETYLVKQSGLLQCAVVLPARGYQDEIVPSCKRILAKLGKETKEFKGTHITKGNVKIYREFLQYTITMTTHVARQSHLRSILTIDADGRLSGSNYEFVLGCVSKALEINGVVNLPNVTMDFCKQMVWLHTHYERMDPKRHKNELVLTFDDSHHNAKDVRSQKIARLGTVIVPAQFGTMLASCANALLPELPPRPLSRIRTVDFQPSQLQFGLQMADLLCHLFMCGLREAKGLHNDKIDLKCGLLKEVLHDFLPPKDVIDALQVSGENLECVNQDLSMTMELDAPCRVRRGSSSQVRQGRPAGRQVCQ